MKFTYVIVLILVLISICTEGKNYDSKDDIVTFLKKERHYRSLKSESESAAAKSKNSTVLERWQNFEKKLKEGANSVIKMMLPYLMQDSGGMNISSQCMRDAMYMISGFKRIRPWAMKFLDSSSKMIDGMFEGTLSSFGVYDQCLDIAVASEKAKDNGKILFNGQYCTMELRLPVPKKTRYYKLGSILPELKNFSKGGTIVSEAAQFAEFMNIVSYRMGFCVPSGCTVQDINQFAAKIGEQVGLDTLVSECEVKTKTELASLDIFVICVYTFTALLVAIGTMIGLYSYYSQTEFKSTSIRILLCFDFVTNFNKLTNTNTSEALSCLHGFRFLSISWVVLGHTYLNVNHHAFLGMKRVASFGEDFAFQAILNGSFAVDSFYFMGGLLVCYLTIQLVKIQKHPFNVSLYIIHRLCRMMPVYVFTLLGLFISRNFGSGPIWHNTIDKFLDYCYDNWWTNLIFINNFYNSSKMCIAQSWYIASDMQLYLGALVILIPMLKSAKVGISLCFVGIGACIIYSAVATYILNFPYAILFTNPDPEQMFDYFGRFYFRPFIHIGPYCVGILTGYLLATQPKLKLSPMIQVIGWCSAFICNFSNIYGIYEWNKGREPYIVEGLLYAGLNRTTWAVGLAWVVVCCCTGHGGVINHILSWKVFIPLGRLSYCVFLIHPIVQNVVMGNIRTLLQPDHIIGVYLFFGHLCISLLVGLGLCMLVESPVIALQKLLMESKVKPRPDNDKNENKVVLKGNLRTVTNGDVAMIITESYKDLRGSDNEAVIYK